MGRSGSSAGWALVLTSSLIALVGCSSGSTSSPPTAPSTAAPSTAATSTQPESEPEVTPESEPAPVSREQRLDQEAGIRSQKVVQKAGGDLEVVPGDVPAPRKADRVYRVRVEVEDGLDLDRKAFAGFVMATLNDPRSWTEDGRRSFARTDGSADIRVVLASPDTSARMCRPLVTFGKLSCRQGDKAVLTMYRWVKGIPDYSGDRDGYRHYVVNHEVGHVLGHGHEYCAGKGERAPVMMQQTKGLKGCRPNSWPHP